jgi:molecular chaperone DnaJ
MERWLLTEGLVMATDCYLILGVPRDASVSRIRRAFMRFCHEHDPDRHLAEPSHHPFETVCDAYETLVNRERRFHHDLALAHAGLNEPYPAQLTDDPVDLVRSFESHQPSREEIEDQFAQNFTGRGVPKSHPVRELTVELMTSDDAATHGGRLPIDVPVARVCRSCEGSGSTGFAPCDDCDARGLFWDTARVDVLLSPPVRDGMVVPVSLRHLGIENLYLRVLVRVAPQTMDA